MCALIYCDDNCLLSMLVKLSEPSLDLSQVCDVFGYKFHGAATPGNSCNPAPFRAIHENSCKAVWQVFLRSDYQTYVFNTFLYSHPRPHPSCSCGLLGFSVCVHTPPIVFDIQLPIGLVKMGDV